METTMVPMTILWTITEQIVGKITASAIMQTAMEQTPVPVIMEQVVPVITFRTTEAMLE